MTCRSWNCHRGLGNRSDRTARGRNCRIRFRISHAEHAGIRRNTCSVLLTGDRTLHGSSHYGATDSGRDHCGRDRGPLGLTARGGRTMRSGRRQSRNLRRWHVPEVHLCRVDSRALGAVGTDHRRQCGARVGMRPRSERDCGLAGRIRHVLRLRRRERWRLLVTRTVGDLRIDGRQTLKRNSTTSPSDITYSLPSMRTLPAALAEAIEPAATRSSKDTISALMKPRSKSV